MTMAACGYSTKKQLKECVGQRLNYEETSLFGSEYCPNGDNNVVGPSAHQRKWFATVTCKDGIITEVS